MSGIQQLLLGGSVQQAVDPYFYSVTSLLHGDGTNGGQNNTFLDSSTNNFTITRNGNTTQGAFSPFSQTGWGNYFDGSSDYIQTPSSAALAFGSGNLTIEAWVYPTAKVRSFPAIYSNNVSFGTNFFEIIYDHDSYAKKFIVYVYNSSSSPILVSGSQFEYNSWYHVALTRSGNSFKLFVNGTEQASTTFAGSVDGGSSHVARIGCGPTTSSDEFAGYVSNARIVKGTAVYTSNFTPSLTPLTAISGTSLLTCQANRFLDASSNAFAITANGNTSVQPFSPFNPTTPYSTSSIGGSAYFDGSGDYLTTTTSSAFDLSSGDWTIQGWYYPTAYSAGNNVVAYVGTSAGDKIVIATIGTGGGLYYLLNGSVVITGGSAPLNAWSFFALVKSGGTTTLYINGVSQGTTTSVPTSSNKSLNLGSDAGAAPYQGYIADFRILKGTANTAVPTAPLTAITNTSLLTNFTNGAIFDNAAVADYETVGNAQISTSVKKYGTGSMAFDGTGDWLTTPYTQSINFGTGDFTIEGWFYLNSFANQYYVLGGTWTTGTSDEWLIQIENNGSLRFLTTANTSFFATGLIKTGTWYHFAASRNAGVIKAYINGNVFATITNANSIGSVSKVLYFGTQNAGTWSFNGYLDDWRVSKGIGRYPYNFTPPTAEFPNIGGTVTLTADPYFDYTTLLLPGNGTNGAQNNTFLDSSTNNFTITRNGNTTQGTFSPFSQTGWGNYFDGTGDWLSVASNAAFGFGAGDFTVEAFVYINAYPSLYYGLIDTRVSSAVGIGTYIDSIGRLVYTNNSTILANAGTIAPRQWVHLAVSRSSGTVKGFINGTEVFSVTDSRTLASSAGIFVGDDAISGNIYGINGYMSNARVVKGTAVYTSNFTPSTTPLTAISGTSLLTCQSNRFIDNSTNAFAITRNGDVSVQAFSPFNPTAAWSAATNGGSGYFDGSGDFLQVADAAPMELGSGNWTIEMWVNTTNNTAYSALFGRDDGAVTAGSYIILLNGATANGIVSFYSADINAFSAAVLTSGTTSCRDGAWHHIAIVRNSNTLTMYIDGTSTSTATFSGSFANTAQPIKIGSETGYSRDYTGYISNVRLVVGTAVYTANFTPPTAPLTAITNTQLLLNNTNAGIYDATSKNDLETVGNAQISTTQSKFGGSSMLFDGTGDWLTIPNGQNFVFGSGDWTVELWVRPASSSRQGFATLGNSSGTNIAWEVGINASGKFRALVQTSGGQVVIDGTTTPSANTWYHVAVARYGGTVTLYVNGIAEATGSVSTNALVTETSPVYVGTYNYGFPLTGYIDDLRITKGIARYTSNFTPPTTAFLTL